MRKPSKAVDEQHAAAQRKSYERLNAAMRRALQQPGRLPARHLVRCCVDGALLELCYVEAVRETWRCPLCGDYYEAVPTLVGAAGPAIVEVSAPAPQAESGSDVPTTEAPAKGRKGKGGK